MEQQKSRKKGFSGEVCPKTRALKGLWNSELITAGFLAQVKLAGIWGAALPWSSSIHSTLTGYRIPNPGGWQMGISSNSLHWDHIGMGNEGLFVNGNIRLFPMLGSHWNGNKRVICQWEYQIIPYAGIPLEWEMKGYFSSTTNTFQRFLHSCKSQMPPNCVCLERWHMLQSSALEVSGILPLPLKCNISILQMQIKRSRMKMGHLELGKASGSVCAAPRIEHWYPPFNSCPSQRFAFISPISF